MQAIEIVGLIAFAIVATSAAWYVQRLIARALPMDGE